MYCVFMCSSSLDYQLNVNANGDITIPVNETMACLNGAVTYIDDDNLYETSQTYTFEVSGPNVTGEVSSTDYTILDSTGKLCSEV